MTFFWIPALIPLLGALILLLCPAWPICKWEGATNTDEIIHNWKKFGIYLAVNILGCAILASLFWWGAVSKQYFPEVWNYRIVSTRHEAQWTTEESETYTTTDSDGNSTTHTRYYTEKHGPYWYTTDEYGSESRIDEQTYNQWIATWGNEKQVGIHKGSSAGWDRSIDGPIKESYWPQTFVTIWPSEEIRKYKNKVRVSNSVFKYGEATKEQKARFPRPADQGNGSPIISYGPAFSEADIMLLRRVNAQLGVANRIHAMLVVFGKEPRSVVTDALVAWQGPNKNELCTFISLDGTNVNWVEVHSWMDNTTLHGIVRDELVSGFSIKKYADLLLEYCPKHWKKKDFTAMNEYLHVSINPIWIILALIFSVILGIVSYFVIENCLGEPDRRTHYDYY